MQNSLEDIDLKVELKNDKIESKEVVLRKSMDNQNETNPKSAKE